LSRHGEVRLRRDFRLGGGSDLQRVNLHRLCDVLELFRAEVGDRHVEPGPLLSNLYLTEVDRMLERAKEATRYGKYTGVEYARFADDLVILIDAHPRHDWLMAAVEKRLREELAELQVEINEEKSRIVDLCRGESFGFLGFDFRRVGRRPPKDRSRLVRPSARRRP
jgi:RNA-directed DNA polymerase